jgi:hypothetical protein
MMASFRDLNFATSKVLPLNELSTSFRGSPKTSTISNNPTTLCSEYIPEDTDVPFRWGPHFNMGQNHEVREKFLIGSIAHWVTSRPPGIRHTPSVSKSDDAMVE